MQAYEDSITLPTCGMRGKNGYAVVYPMYGVAHIFPYTMLDDLTPTPQDRTYRTPELENGYLRVTVWPDLGGRVYSVCDELSKRGVFYKNSVMKLAPLAIRGAFFPGGVEFSSFIAPSTITGGTGLGLRVPCDEIL